MNSIKRLQRQVYLWHRGAHSTHLNQASISPIYYWRDPRVKQMLAPLWLNEGVISILHNQEQVEHNVSPFQSAATLISWQTSAQVFSLAHLLPQIIEEGFTLQPTTRWWSRRSGHPIHQQSPARRQPSPFTWSFSHKSACRPHKDGRRCWLNPGCFDDRVRRRFTGADFVVAQVPPATCYLHVIITLSLLLTFFSRTPFSSPFLVLLRR